MADSVATIMADIGQQGSMRSLGHGMGGAVLRKVAWHGVVSVNKSHYCMKG